MTPTAIALQFNEHIGNRDPEGLAALMTDDHIFIDSAGNTISGKEANRKNWIAFFNMFPYYENVFEEISETDYTVTLHGYSVCSDKVLDNVRAIWTAEISGGKVRMWKVDHL